MCYHEILLLLRVKIDVRTAPRKNFAVIVTIVTFYYKKKFFEEISVG